MAVKLIRRKDGTRYYQIDFRDQDGRRIREHGGATKTQAIHKLSKRKAEVREGEYVNPKSIRINTVKGSADRFLESRPDSGSPFYPQTVKIIVENYGDEPLVDAFSPYRARVFQRWLETRGTKPSTLRKTMQVTVTWCNWARDEGLLPDNHHYKVGKLPPEPGPVRGYLAPEQWRSFLAHADPDDAKLAELTVAMGGRRFKEVGCLTRDQIDWSMGVVNVWQFKTSSAVEIPIGTVARGILRDGSGEYVLSDAAGAPLYATTAQRNAASHRIKNAMKRAGIPPWKAPDGRVITPSFKWLRDTVGTWLGQTGRFNDQQIGVLLGHNWASRNMTGRYVHYQADDLLEMVSALDGILTKRMDTAADTAAPKALTA